LLTLFIGRRSVTAARFWAFLEKILSGQSVEGAWKSVRSIHTVECGYRLWDAFRRFQPTLRSLLCRIQ
jgi:hypothetical protein